MKSGSCTIVVMSAQEIMLWANTYIQCKHLLQTEGMRKRHALQVVRHAACSEAPQSVADPRCTTSRTEHLSGAAAHNGTSMFMRSCWRIQSQNMTSR